MAALFIASAGPHVGKTTTSLGLFSELTKPVSRAAFIKPCGSGQRPLRTAPEYMSVVVNKYACDRPGVRLCGVILNRGS
ncbi:MAG: hypothetical protein EA427_03675 [Spirochaetaceae bacterium]|nr:MAG: hypothetical protein EA427_03675 [Spirochaetaceae bacterium]